MYKVLKSTKNKCSIKVNKHIISLSKDSVKYVDDSHIEIKLTQTLSNRYQYLTHNLKNIQKALGYKFKNIDLLKYAFIRQTAAEPLGINGNCELLEFLGDRVLYCLAFKKNSYKIMNDKKAFLTNRTGETFRLLFRETTNAKFYEIIKDANLNQYMVSPDITELKSEKSIADLYEAIIGAIVLDCNYDMNTAYKVMEKLESNIPRGKGLLARINKMNGED